jgi:type II secretory pathway pseudopilin PulG
LNTKSAGYSLLEVLIAFFVMATVLAVLIPEQGGLLQRGRESQAETLAYDYAHSVIASRSVSRELQPDSERFDYRDWSVDVALEELGISTGPMTVFRIEVRVSGSNGRALAHAQGMITR